MKPTNLNNLDLRAITYDFGYLKGQARNIVDSITDIKYVSLTFILIWGTP